VSDLVTLQRSERHSDIAVVTLNSPQRRNALSRALLHQLLERLEVAAADDRVKGVLLTSSGRVFCSGADLVEASEHGMEESSRLIVEVQRALVALPVPVVAKVVGPVRAGGIGLLTASDIVVVADEATFALTEARFGLAPAAVSATVLPTLSRRAAALAFLTARTHDGPSAAAAGLATMSVPATDVDATVEGVLAEISACSRQGLTQSKALLSGRLLRHIDEHGQQLATTSSTLFASTEARARMKRFLATTSAG